MAKTQLLLKAAFPRCHELDDGRIVFEPERGVSIIWTRDGDRCSVKIRSSTKGREIDAVF
jgi:hypothetical protein